MVSRCPACGFISGQKEGVEKGSFGNVEAIISLACHHLKRQFIESGNKGV